MSTSITSWNPLACVVEHGETLRVLKQRAKHKEGDNICEQVDQVITELLQSFNREQDQVSLFPQESVARFLKKTRETLEEFMKLDPDSKPKYEILASKVTDFKLGVESSGVTSPLLGDDSEHGQSFDFKHLVEEVEEELAKLTDKEFECLFWFTIFPAGVVIKKRQLIHLWLGLDLIQDPLEGQEVLANLVAEGLILLAIGNRMVSSRYRMNHSVHSKVQLAMEPIAMISQQGFWNLMYSKFNRRQQRWRSLIWNLTLMSQEEKTACEALLNVGESVLNPSTFEGLSEMRNVKVLHLGSWRSDPKNYVVVEDIEVLKVLKNMDRVRVLSLSGISGLEKLPDSVYQLQNLKVFDLRACHNLGLLSREINSLKQLTLLDLSECYLLDHIPREITSLSNLQVMKGFIINPNQKVGKGIAKGENSASACAFSELSKLKNLLKLTIRSRKLSFPSAEDVRTLCELPKLISLRIAWTGSSNDCQPYGGLGSLFPSKLQKLDLQAAPEGTASRLLALISIAGVNCLEKLYIRGGGLSDISPDKHCLHVKVVRLRYLPEFHIHWVKFRQSFPSLRRLETLGCPYLLFFPCDSHGVWEFTEED